MHTHERQPKAKHPRSHTPSHRHMHNNLQKYFAYNAFRLVLLSGDNAERRKQETAHKVSEITQQQRQVAAVCVCMTLSQFVRLHSA